jgi:D-alanine-D-alanine ligase
MRICLLTSQDLFADPFPVDDWPCDPRPFFDAEWHVEDLSGQDGPARVAELAADGFDLFFNLCDGAADEDRPGIEVVLALESLGVPFTGATSSYYEPTRQQMKDACAREGIAFPAHVLAETPEDVERAAAELPFPLFVKHHNSYASVSLSRASRVQTPAGLWRQARKIMKRHGKALIEEYIDGHEYTVLVAENPADLENPTTYQPIRYEFPEGESFKHEKMKWIEFDKMATVAVADADLDTKLRDVSARCFRALGGASFGRCDIRVDAAGTPYVLEINPNCGVYYAPDAYGGADLCLANDPAGHEGFTRQLVAAALARHARSRGGTS